MYVWVILPPHWAHGAGTAGGARRAYKNQEIKPGGRPPRAMRAILCAAALAAAALLPAHAECGGGLLEMSSPSGSGACVGAHTARVLEERGWSHAPLSVSVLDTVTVASTADSLLPADSVVSRVLEGSGITEEARLLVHEAYWATRDRINVLTGAETAWLEQNPVVRVAYEHHWPPLEYEKDGRIGGLTAAYLERFEEFTGAEFVPVRAVSLTDEANKIEAGEADMAVMSVDSGKKREYMYFTEFHTALAANIVTYGDRGISADDLPYVRLGTVRGGEIEEWLDTRHRSLDYVSLHSHSAAFEALRDGRIDALVDSWMVSDHMAALGGFEGLHNAGSAGHISELSVGCSKEKIVLCRILAKALEAIPDREREAMLIEAIGESATDRDIAVEVHEAYMATKQRVSELGAEDREWLSGRDSVRVVYGPDWPPLEFVEPDGSLGGLAGMYADAFSEFSGVEFAPHPTRSWSDAVNRLYSGEADVSIMITETDERLRYMGFTEPHTILSYSMITRGEAELGPEDIGGLRLGTIRGYGVEDWLDLHHPGIEYVSISSHGGAFEALEEGRIDALVEIWPVVSRIADKAGMDGLHNAGPIGHTMDLSVGYTKTEPVLGDVVKKALASISEDRREEMLVEAILAPYLETRAAE